MNGEGQITTEKDYVIEGKFKMGQLHGKGKRKYKGGKVLTGEWDCGELVKGRLENEDGTAYEGEWVGGRPHGNGVKIISNGKRYEGQFSLGRPWGKGCKLSGNKREEGYWDKAKFMAQQQVTGLSASPSSMQVSFHNTDSNLIMLTGNNCFKQYKIQEGN